MNKNEIWISEIFKSLSGEGKELGTPTIFVRVFACNMKPVCPWCDSMYAVQNTDRTAQRVPIESVVNKIRELDCLDVTFTGGEPLMYIEQMQDIMKLLTLNGEKYKFHFETNGLIAVVDEFKDYNVDYTVSPKFHAMDLKEDMHIKNDCGYYIGKLRKMCTFNGKRMTFKFVYEGGETIRNIKFLRRMLMGLDNNIPIYLMPEGNIFNKKNYLECAEMCLKYGFKMSPRLHNILWGPKRGV